MKALVSDVLRDRVRRSGADPLTTYYHVTKAERIELSATTFGNWVDKTANLLSWDIAVAPGDAVALPLARTHPGHWMTAVWQLALWQVGAYVDLASNDAGVVVCGPQWQEHEGGGADVLACSLHPFATGLGDGLPATITDADLAIRAQPDSHTPARVDPATLAWADVERRLTHAEVAALPGSPERRLTVPSDPWTTARDGIVAALLGGGSVVTVVAGSDADLTRIAAAERAHLRSA